KAFFRIPVQSADLWRGVPEPSERYGFEWYKNARARRGHQRAMRKSLETFLNERLARLYQMLRTGWWVVGKVRVRVVVFSPVPERVFREFARALGVPYQPRAPKRKK